MVVVIDASYAKAPKQHRLWWADNWQGLPDRTQGGPVRHLYCWRTRGEVSE
jgi:hypothetical protein